MSFPVSPVNGQITTVNGIRYSFNSTVNSWTRISPGRYTASATGPTNASTGDHWYDTNEDVLYEWTFDGTSYYWVDISSGLVAGTTTTVLPFHPFLLSGM
jgi:hypothetical protein